MRSFNTQEKLEIQVAKMSKVTNAELHRFGCQHEHYEWFSSSHSASNGIQFNVKLLDYFSFFSPQ